MPRDKASPKANSPNAGVSPKSASPRSATGSPRDAIAVGPGAGLIVLEPDETEDEPVLDDADSALGSFQSSTVSLRDEMIRQLSEHGRQYQGYMEAKYVLPMDEQEIERLDFQCHLVWMTLDKQHNLAPLSNNLRRALDVGCGTGIWAIEFADDHPGTEVLGVDLAPVQPQRRGNINKCVLAMRLTDDSIPPNLSFEVDDLEQPWGFSRKFDYIHCQLMIGAFKDWPKFFAQGFEFLEDVGYLEVHDIDFVIKCDDDTLPEDSALVRWHRYMHEAAATAGFPLDAIAHVPEMMKSAGFRDVVATPIKWPINTWPKDSKHKELGRWAMENFAWGCESMSLALFTRVLNWSADEVRIFMALVRQDLRNRKIHAYWNFWAVYGRKPGTAGSGSSSNEIATP